MNDFLQNLLYDCLEELVYASNKLIFKKANYRLSNTMADGT
jgi:hypothetical protein